MSWTTMTERFVVPLAGLVLAWALALAAGCKTAAGTGTLAGGGVGALIGQLASGNTTGTLIRADVGAGLAYIIGNEADKAEAKKREKATEAEMAPFAGTAWQLLNVNPPAPTPLMRVSSSPAIRRA